MLDLGGDGTELRCGDEGRRLVGDGMVFEVGEERHVNGDGGAETVAHGGAAESG